MITLKEAFRQQSFMRELISECCRLMHDEDFYTKKTEKHLRAKALPGQENEEIDISEKRRHTVADTITFCRYLMDEEELLAHAVHQAKSAMDFDIDTAVIVNKSRRRFAEIMRSATDFETEQTINRGGGTSYVLDKDGKPSTFNYDVETVVTIDFDRNKVKEQSQKLFAASEKTSLELDRAMLAEIVDYKPKFDPNDSMQNILDDFLAKQK